MKEYIDLPQLLLIEDNPLDAQIAQIQLESVGFQVIHTGSILEGEAFAIQLLSHDSPSAPLLLLLDIRVPDPSHPDLTSPLLVAALSGRMQRNEIRLAPMVALTSLVTPDIEEEAIFAGCAHVLAKPLTYKHALWLHQFALEPVHLPLLDQDRRLYQQKAEEIIGLVRRASGPRMWTEEDAHLLLSATTQYPPPKPLDSARQAMLMLRLGDIQATRNTLVRFAEQLAEPDQTLLLAFLTGKQQRQMASLFPDYDRTTIYRHIQSLPKRLAGWLRVS